jgi:hypothetical protein
MAFEQSGKLTAVVGLRGLLPLITDTRSPRDHSIQPQMLPAILIAICR